MPKAKKEQLNRSVSSAKELPADDRVRWLRDQALELYADARGSNSHIAAEKALRAVVMLDERLRAIEDAERAKDEASAEGLSEEQYLERLRARAAAMPDAHLEVFLAAWLDRHRNARVVVSEVARAG